MAEVTLLMTPIKQNCYSLFRSLKTSVVNRVVTALTSMR